MTTDKDSEYAEPRVPCIHPTWRTQPGDAAAMSLIVIEGGAKMLKAEQDRVVCAECGMTMAQALCPHREWMTTKTVVCPDPAVMDAARLAQLTLTDPTWLCVRCTLPYPAPATP